MRHSSIAGLALMASPRKYRSAFATCAMRKWPSIPTRSTFSTSSVPPGCGSRCSHGSAGEQRAKIERFDLARHFDHIHIEGEHGIGKPDPAVFHCAFKALDCGPDTTWMVGDNLDADIAGALGVGMTAVWIDHQGLGLPPGASA